MKPRMHLNWQHKLYSALYIITVFIFFLMTGCKTVTKDGPPPYDVDVSKIPNAQPKLEKMSKYGNMPVYRVNGKNYYVMNSSKNYEAEGTASWYGTKFHRHNTSSGEKYDMLSMTAAHRTLPLPTYLEVTNEENGRHVIVKVNDRGPFADNRLLDLSYAAAKKLGMIGHGTAYVKIKAIDPMEYQNKAPIYTNSFYIVSNKNKANIPSEFAKNETQHNSFASTTLTETTTSLAKNNSAISTEKTHAAFKAKQMQYAKHTTHNNPAKTVASNKSLNTTVSPSSEQLALKQALHDKQSPTKQFASDKSLRPKSLIYLQVGAFSNKSYAEKLKKQLSSVVASNVQITERSGGTKKLYRVQIGPIKDSMAVARINKQLKSIGLSSKVLFV